MKFAGIDGVILDWYGIRKHNDYAVIHRNSQHFIKHLRRAGLKFAVNRMPSPSSCFPTAQQKPGKRYWHCGTV